ncbi:PQQ-binding-like beta-propeller repeat protein [Puia sp. P3]|uniref:outer membrane protein assembly factor BamB family protein n=1 Tax=Puia sp. P3 TaxID=3423952 RepID=UPI003D66E403
MYGVGPKLKLFALDAASGRQLWQFDPFEGKEPRLNECRGVTYWNNRIFYVAGAELFAVNAQTGEPVEGFGESGKVAFTTGLDINHDVKHLYVTATSPGIVYKNILIYGSAVSEAGNAAPGYVRGFDAQTGQLVWTFHTIPQPGEPGYETWPKDAYKWAGGTNNWGGMSLDERRGMVYFGTGSPSSDFYGGDREGKNLFSDCVLALDAGSGRLKWYYQTTHHDLWDRDIPCPPNLTTIRRDGKLIDVVVQVTKGGNVFVLDRDSGKSVFPVEERPVPIVGLPGEKPWPTQPVPVKPEPLCGPFISDSANYLPPGEKGTVLVGYSGGAEWGGNAVDTNGVFYQNSNNAPWLLQMVSMAERKKRSRRCRKGRVCM